MLVKKQPRTVTSERNLSEPQIVQAHCLEAHLRQESWQEDLNKAQQPHCVQKGRDQRDASEGSRTVQGRVLEKTGLRAAV